VSVFRVSFDDVSAIFQVKGRYGWDPLLAACGRPKGIVDGRRGCLTLLRELGYALCLILLISHTMNKIPNTTQEARSRRGEA
jgi:hypothetical protein